MILKIIILETAKKTSSLLASYCKLGTALKTDLILIIWLLWLSFPQTDEDDVYSIPFQVTKTYHSDTLAVLCIILKTLAIRRQLKKILYMTILVLPLAWYVYMERYKQPLHE